MADTNQPPGALLDGEIPVIQLSELEEAAPVSKDPQDSNELQAVNDFAGLGISEDTAISDAAAQRTPSPVSSESKPKKKKAKSKGKNKRTKATAEVTIGSSTLVSAKPGEPIHEFKGNDATSDSSSQTLGRASPVSRRPTLEQIVVAKQPKPLLEPRPARGIRRKHNSVHHSVHSSAHSSNADDTDSTEDVFGADPSQNFTVILASDVNVTFFVSPGCLLSLILPNIIEQQEQSEKKSLDYVTLKPEATLESPESPPKSTAKLTPTPEKPYDGIETTDVEAPSPAVEKSKEKLRQFNEREAAQKMKFA